MVEPTPSVMESPRADMVWAPAGARTTTASAKYQALDCVPNGVPLWSLAKSPVPDLNVYCIARLCAVITAAVPCSARLIARSLCGSTLPDSRSLSATAPAGIVTESEPPKVSCRLLPGTSAAEDAEVGTP